MKSSSFISSASSADPLGVNSPVFTLTDRHKTTRFSVPATSHVNANASLLYHPKIGNATLFSKTFFITKKRSGKAYLKNLKIGENSLVKATMTGVSFFLIVFFFASSRLGFARVHNRPLFRL